MKYVRHPLTLFVVFALLWHHGYNVMPRWFAVYLVDFTNPTKTMTAICTALSVMAIPCCVIPALLVWEPCRAVWRIFLAAAGPAAAATYVTVLGLIRDHFLYYSVLITTGVTLALAAITAVTAGFAHRAVVRRTSSTHTAYAGSL